MKDFYEWWERGACIAEVERESTQKKQAERTRRIIEADEEDGKSFRRSGSRSQPRYGRRDMS